MTPDQLDAEKRGPMAALVDGEPHQIPPATELPWKLVVACATSPHWFALVAWPRDVKLKAWQIEVAQDAWRVHNGLPEASQVKRLVYMIEKYHDGLEYDLRTKVGVSLGELWRDRRWRELLVYIDHLPTDTHKNRLMTNDEEYMAAVMEQSQRGDGRPSMAEWGQTNIQLAMLIDAINRNTAVTQAVANPKAGMPKIQPAPRPSTVMEKLEFKKSQREHESMNAMLLRGRE